MRLLRHTLIYSGVSILQKSAGFFLMPLYTRCLSPKDYGVIGTLSSFTGLVGNLCMLCLTAAGQKLEFDTEGENRRRMWGTLFTFVSLFGFMVVVILTTTSRWVVNPLVPKIVFFPYTLMALVTMALNQPFYLFQTFLITRRQALRFAMHALANFALSLTFTLLFVVGLKQGAMGVLSAGLVTSAVFGLSVWWVMRQETTFGLDWSWLRRALRYSLPILPHMVFSWTVVYADRLLLNYFRSAAEVGFYTVALQFGGLLNVVTGAANQAYVPWFFEQMKHGPDGQLRIVRLAVAASAVYAWLALALAFVCQEILPVMTASPYHAAWRLLPFVFAAGAFDGVYFFFVNTLFVRVSGLVPLVTLVGSVFSVAANLWLIPRFGFLGAGIALPIGAAASCATALAISKWKEPLPFHWFAMLGFPAAALGVGQLVFLNGYFSWTTFLLMKAVTLVVTALGGVLLIRRWVPLSDLGVWRKNI